MKKNVEFSQIVENLVKVFGNENEAKLYNTTAEQYDVYCGWCGTMSPVTRPAYIKDFGADTVETAERAARLKLNQNANTYETSRHAAAMMEAQQAEKEHKAPAAGSFVLAVNSGMKADGGDGLYNELTAAAEDPEWIAEKEAAPRLCKVVEVYEVTADQMTDPATADRLVMEARENGREFAGGAEVAEEDRDRRDLLDEYRYYYTLCAAVVCGSRWFLIDSEGYSYARYIYMPTNWREMFAQEWAQAQSKEQARRAAEAQREADEKAARLADYVSRCKKYAGRLEDITTLQKAAEITFKAESEAGQAHGWRSPEYKEAKKKNRAADCALAAARRRNLVAMAATMYPGIKAKANKADRWAGAYDVTYYDGPRLEDFNKATDYDLFIQVRETFDGYTDSTEYIHAEFTEFGAKYMGITYGDYRTAREWSDETRARLIGDVLAVVPGSADEVNTYESRHTWTADELRAIGEKTGANVSYLLSRWEDCGAAAWIHAETVARWCFDTLDLYTAPTEPEKPRKGSKAAEGVTTKGEGCEAVTGDETAPAEGLELREVDGVLCVIGNSHTTFKNMTAIKAHGCKWNKPAKRWEAQTEEARESCRRWFALRDTLETAQEITDTPDTLETAQDITAPASEGEGTAKYYAAILKAEGYERGRAVLFRIGRRAIVCAGNGEGWNMSNADGTGTQYDLTTEEAADVLALDYEDRDTAAHLEDITRTAEGIDKTADGLEFRAVVAGCESQEIEHAFLTIEEAHGAGFYGRQLDADPAAWCNGSEGYRGGRLLLECCRPEDAGTERIAYGETYERAAARYRAGLFGLRHALAVLPEWLHEGTRFVLIDYNTGKPTKCAYHCESIDRELKTVTIPEARDTFRAGSCVYGWECWHWAQFAPLTDETDPTPDPSDGGNGDGIESEGDTLETAQDITDSTATATAAATLEPDGEIITHYDNPAPELPEKSPADMSEEERREFIDGLFIHRVKAGFNRLQSLPICCECIQKLKAEGCEDMAKAFRSLVVFNAMLHPDWSDAQIFADIYENLEKRHAA